VITAKYNLRIAKSVDFNYLFTYHNYYIPITQGTDTLVNYIAYPAVNVTVHLINRTNYSQINFQLNINDTLALNNIYTSGEIYVNDPDILMDTIFNYPLAHYSHVSFTSNFAGSFGYPINKSIKQSYILGNKDTLINITNP